MCRKSYTYTNHKYYHASTFSNGFLHLCIARPIYPKVCAMSSVQYISLQAHRKQAKLLNILLTIFAKMVILAMRAREGSRERRRICIHGRYALQSKEKFKQNALTSFSIIAALKLHWLPYICRVSFSLLYLIFSFNYLLHIW